MKFIVLCAVATFGFISPVTGRDPDWFIRRSADLENAINIQGNNERVSALGEFMSLASHGEMDEQQKIIFNRAQAQLVAIPGHAEYYRDRILQAQERLKNPGGGTTWADYLKEVRNGFQIFPHLHSPEGVRVLGEMMSNDWVLPGNETRDLSERVPILSESATVALAGFPLKGKPFNDRVIRKNYESAHAAWMLWYEQIKAGNRTFRFEGDPTEYDLNGPASKEKVQRNERDRKRDEEREAGHRKSSTTPDAGSPLAVAAKPFYIAGILAACALIGGAAWYYVKRRNAAW